MKKRIPILMIIKNLINKGIFNSNKGIRNEASANLIESFGIGNQVYIKNTKIFNNYINDDMPLILNRLSSLKANHLFTIEYSDSTVISNTTFENTSTIFQVLNSYITIEDSVFKNYNIKNSLPLIDYGKMSNIIISNTCFQNITIQGNGIFGEETQYKLSNINVSHSKINSEAFINFNYNNRIELSNIEINDVQCLGDNSSLIKINTNELENSKINIEQLKIYSCQSNGPLIKFKGNMNQIFLKDITIQNNYAYGSLIENTSKKSTMNIDDLIMLNNTNLNKNNCGIFQISNGNQELEILNSEFNNNIANGNGGALCLNDLLSRSIKLYNNKFNNNVSDKNGGAIYIDNYIEGEIILINNTFKENESTYFGGAIYLNKFNKISIEDSKFTGNYAGVSGGAIYTVNDSISYISNIKGNFKGNKASSYGSDYSSQPYYIALNNYNDFIYQKYQSGDYIPLEFSLYDKYNQLVVDRLKYFSDITLKVEVELNDDDEMLDSLIINKSGNIGSFVQGKCDLKYFRILSNKSLNITLKFVSDNNDYHLIFNTTSINLKLNGCDSRNQVTIIDNNRCFHCEQPICHSWCNSTVSYCLPSTINPNVNSPEYNECVCKDGYTGEDCQEYIYEDLL
ncbi:hypothetical protein BCR36DRAFT_366923 [Piromyces finnis]|uniref:EGF-like domain-containing protein n=1 Tax=Piromyces finnis TaxID=1754191 RepID=A0A1Y1VJ32_9FUNG|nr:hypothetical protein BCR36DRAFT_366923 [Piromyces finnis]|eukprot:ORX57719.1 hypothetical protein BCR36DRAFT_366923 [Piromyces finnis]